MYNDRNTEHSGFLHILPRMALFAVIGMTLTLMASLIMALLISSGSLSEASGDYTALCCIPGSLICGFFTAKCAGKHLLLWGVISGAGYLALLAVINALFLPSFGGNIAGVLVSSLGGALIGAILCAMLRK